MDNNAVKGVYYCNQYRTLQLSNRMYERNVPGVPLQMNYDTRPVDTKFKVFPILDCRTPSYTKCERRPIYNTRHMFAGSSQALPFNGYQAKVDTESALKNIIFPLQECPQSKFIPGSRSDMYNTTYLTPPIETTKMTNNLLRHRTLLLVLAQRVDVTAESTPPEIPITKPFMFELFR